jgi:TonB-dependent SusC/RagA subfamily outer membrane receptor
MMHAWSALGAAALAVTLALPAAAQTRVLAGQVVDSLTGRAITSGQVTVLGTGLVAPIHEDGSFSLSVPLRDITLSARGSAGYKVKEQQVRPTDDEVVIRVERDFFNQDAQVASGQATTVERKNLATAVGEVRSEDLARSSGGRMDQALKGQVAGAEVREGTQPGAVIAMRLRGISTLLGNTTPLYIVDGVTVFGIDHITPNDIEHIEVLKGASAGAQYGSKASNGVVIIRTKRGGLSGRGNR